MPKEYLRDQLWKLYEKLPEELQDAIFSAETADTMDSICEKKQCSRRKIPEVAKYTGRVLMGLLPPNELEETLEKEVKLKEETAKSVAREINRFVFFPIKEVLGQIYEMEIAPPARPPGVIQEEPESMIEEKQERSDTYREPIE